MLKHHILISYRNLIRNKLFSTINILGLALGLACSLLILLWVNDELKTNRFHENSDRLFQVISEVEFTNGKVEYGHTVASPLAEALKAEIPEIEDVIRMDWGTRNLLLVEGNGIQELGLHADASFFEAFSFKLKQGNPATVLEGMHSIVISQNLADKFFPNYPNPLGKIINVRNWDGDTPFKVTGVFDKIPAHSSLKFDYILPYNFYLSKREWLNRWGNMSIKMNVLLKEGADYEQVNKKLSGFIAHHIDEEKSTEVFLQPYKDIHLYQQFSKGRKASGRIAYVRLFGIVAIFILIIGCINFMNLSTAKAGNRAKEVGIRKVVGAKKPSLMGQFLGESMFITLIAMLLAVAFVEVLRPTFNQLTNKEIEIPYFNTEFLLFVLIISLVTSILSGSYPAVFLSSFVPVKVLKGTFKLGASGDWVRRSLVIFQFVLSATLITCTLLIHDQISFIQTKNLGMDRENVLYFGINEGISKHDVTFMNELKQLPGITQAAYAGEIPLSVGNWTTDPRWDGKKEGEEIAFHVISCDYGFLETMKMELAEGRSFDAKMVTDSLNYIVNEEAIKQMGIENPIGKSLKFWRDEPGTIIGVVKNFHHQSLHSPIEPIIIRLDPNQTWNVFAKLDNNHLSETLKKIEYLYKKYEPEYPFEYTFMDDKFKQMYSKELLVGTLSNYAAGLAIFISCLGLFGLTVYTTSQRTKEIGIRKVMGASIPRLVLMLTSKFTVLILLSLIIAFPASYLIMSNWMDDFTFRAEISLEKFLIAGGLALSIAWLTIGYQAIKVSVRNPIDALKYE